MAHASTHCDQRAFNNDNGEEEDKQGEREKEQSKARENKTTEQEQRGGERECNRRERAEALKASRRCGRVAALRHSACKLDNERAARWRCDGTSVAYRASSAHRWIGFEQPLTVGTKQPARCRVYAELHRCCMRKSAMLVYMLRVSGKQRTANQRNRRRHTHRRYTASSTQRCI